MRCPKCDKTVSQYDKFCRHCGERVVVPPTPPPSTAGQITLPIQASDFGPGEILAAVDDSAGTGWGAHIYTGGNKFTFQIETQPEGSPDWLAKSDWSRWFTRGLTIWSHSSRAIGAMHASDVLELLHKLQSGAEWHSDGIAIIERREEYKENRPRKRRSRKKEIEPVAPPEPAKLEKVIVETERLRLQGSAAEQFFAYLQSNEAQLQHMAQEESDRLEEWRRVNGPKILKLLIDIHRQRQIREFDSSKRKAAWVRQEYPLAFICDMPPDRGTIRLDKDELWWRPVIERPNRMKYDYDTFLDLDKAMDWVEQKIQELRADDEARTRKQAEEDAQERERLAALKMDLAPYWISPDALEPKQITYRAFIELDYEPYRSSKTEISFGQFWHHDEKFHAPEVLARELRLNTGTATVEQITRLLGIYFIFSAVTYYESHLAAAQAQKIWDQSAISERFQQGHVRRARYGFQEIETEYSVWIGKLEGPRELSTWGAQETREEYISNGALRETLLRALDVHGYRLFADMPCRYMDDEKLLRCMHGVRAESRYQSDEARRESELWLSAHPQQSILRKQSAEST